MATFKGDRPPPGHGIPTIQEELARALRRSSGIRSRSSAPRGPTPGSTPRGRSRISTRPTCRSRARACAGRSTTSSRRTSWSARSSPSRRPSTPCSRPRASGTSSSSGTTPTARCCSTTWRGTAGSGSTSTRCAPRPPVSWGPTTSPASPAPATGRERGPHYLFVRHHPPRAPAGHRRRRQRVPLEHGADHGRDAGGSGARPLPPGRHPRHARSPQPKGRRLDGPAARAVLAVDQVRAGAGGNGGGGDRWTAACGFALSTSRDGRVSRSEVRGVRNRKRRRLTRRKTTRGW